MARNDLRKLKRIELLDMMIEQGKQLEQQTERAAELEERAHKLEVQVQACEDRIGHLKERLERASVVNDQLREQARTAQQDQSSAAKEAKDLRKENIVLAAKLDEATRQLKSLSGAQLPGLGSSDKEALSALAQRMESAIEQSQAADLERTARLEAILVNQQEIIDDLTARNAPVSGRHVAPSAFAPVVDEPEEAAPIFRLSSLGKKKKKKKGK